MHTLQYPQNTPRYSKTAPGTPNAPLSPRKSLRYFQALVSQSERHLAYTNRVKLLRRLQTGGKNGFTCPRPKVLTFEYAAQNLEDQKLPRQMDTLTEGEQPVENYEMVRSIYNLYTRFKLQFTKK